MGALALGTAIRGVGSLPFADDGLGGGRYGRELDAQLAWKGAAGLSLIAKGAHFESDGFAADVTKLWLVASTTVAIGR